MRTPAPTAGAGVRVTEEVRGRRGRFAQLARTARMRVRYGP
ncbi:hypothetical protein [Haladaptatus sp. W1]|nr:hypothetical protein [Haladaptatus sp. W1]